MSKQIDNGYGLIKGVITSLIGESETFFEMEQSCKLYLKARALKQKMDAEMYFHGGGQNEPMQSVAEQPAIMTGAELETMKGK